MNREKMNTCENTLKQMTIEVFTSANFACRSQNAYDLMLPRRNTTHWSLTVWIKKTISWQRLN